MRKLENLDLGKVSDLAYLLRRPYEEMESSSGNSLVGILKQAKQKITVHLYPVHRSRALSDSLIGWKEYYAQIYFAILEGKIFYGTGAGCGSGYREMFNLYLDEFLEDEKLRKETPTAVIVTGRGNSIPAYYFHDTYAYVLSSDIGCNYSLISYDQVLKSGLHFSNRGRWGPDGAEEITFHEGDKEKLIYRAVREDLWLKELNKRLEESRD